jgi:nitrite reductase (NADH) large subunit
VYKKLVLKDDKLVGACLYGDTVDGSWYFKLLRDGRSVADLRNRLMFGQSNMGDGGHQGQNKAATMADDDEVCGCNGVTKGQICKAIKDKGLFTLDEVRKHTKASASCGSCTGLVEQILMATAGGDYSATPKTKPLCACTDHGHQAVRDAIATHRLLTVAAVFAFMEWKTPNGCASCRPAINYYLISTWPKLARTTRKAASSTSAATPTSRRTAPTASCRACGAARPRPPSCAASPTWWTSTESRR